MGELGFFGILIPEEYGGLGLGVFEYCLVTEELARGWMSVASIIARGNGLSARAGRGRARRKILPMMARGEYLGAFALSEPDAGSDVAAIRAAPSATATSGCITGQKMWCTFADGADYIVRGRPHHAVRLRRPSRGHRSASRREGARHLSEGCTGTPIPQDRLPRLEDLGAVVRRLSRARTPGRRRRWRRATARGLHRRRVRAWTCRARPHRRALRSAWRAARWRTPSPTRKNACSSASPIGDFQAIRFKIADMATEIEAARQLMYYVCSDARRRRAVRHTRPRWSSSSPARWPSG